MVLRQTLLNTPLTNAVKPRKHVGPAGPLERQLGKNRNKAHINLVILENDGMASSQLLLVRI